MREEDKAALAQVLAHFNDLVSDVNLEDPGSGPNAKELDSVSLQEYCIQTFQSELIAGLFDTIIQSLIGVEAKDVSLLAFLISLKAGTGFEAVTSDGKNGGQQLRVRQGKKFNTPTIYMISTILTPFQKATKPFPRIWRRN